MKTFADIQVPGFVSESLKSYFLDFSKPKEFADDNFKFDDNGRRFSIQLENTVGKGEIARYKQFIFSHSVFKRLELQTHKNQGLFEKGFIRIDVSHTMVIVLTFSKTSPGFYVFAVQVFRKPFPIVFCTHLENFLPFSSNLELSANSFNLEESKICCLGKGQGSRMASVVVANTCLSMDVNKPIWFLMTVLAAFSHFYYNILCSIPHKMNVLWRILESTCLFFCVQNTSKFVLGTLPTILLQLY